MTMYRPPQNTNRVKSIKSKFENIENSPQDKNGYRNNLKVNISNDEKSQTGKLSVERQLSDPCKRNIKRTPAFRVDRSVERTSEFQRNCFNRSTLFESKVKQFSAVKNNCDNLSVAETNVTTTHKPLLVKSKTSHDFQYIRSKFDNSVSNNVNKDTSQSTDSNDKIDLSLLYTEPIPKSLRNKNENPPSDDIYTRSTLKLNDNFITDTLKSALKKPLPKGPAPRKPPRTFQHGVTVDNLEKNISFLHEERKTKTVPKKADPKYMLSKLENALRNNKLKVRRQSKVDISTSGEDSDDSLLFRSKSNRTLPKLPSQHTEYTNSAFNFNCLTGFGCTIDNYEKIKEPNSSFFVSSQQEPIYAEPYHSRKDSLDLEVSNRHDSTRSKSTCKSQRNSLYYMSTPVLCDGGKCVVDMNEFGIQDDLKLPDLNRNGNFHRPPSTENSSLSSFTSDLDSTPSPMEEPSKIRSIVEAYETRSIICHTDSTNRVENLKNSLRKTLDRSFAYDSAIRDSDSENDCENRVSDIIRKFETYRQCMPKYCKPKIHKDSLFYCCLVIEKSKDIAQIKLKYPACVDVPENLENLCFPESENFTLDSENSTQNYSLLITNDKGERMYGYCRRVLPEGCTKCLPLAYCILSKYRAPRFYKSILVELESRHGIQNKLRDELISQFYNQKFPKPGDSIRINLTNIDLRSSQPEDNAYGESPDKNKKSCPIPSYIVENNGQTELVMTLHPDTRYEDADLKKLHQLPADILLKIFSSLLLERKVILISVFIGKLSSCMDSLQSILYPFTWHHTFIPILPRQLWDIVESPTPVICGVLSNEVVEYHQIENGIVVDLDSNIVRREEGDENTIISGSMQKVWKRSLALANKAAASMDYVHSVYLSDAYLQVFILCFKDYKKYFVDSVFQKEEFIRNSKTKGIRRFLKMFTETYMFLAFVDTVLTSPENLIEFDKKIEMYGSSESDVILEKLLEWKL